MPRKVFVYIEPSHWARYWFAEFVKPMFDAGALDYELVEPDHTAEFIGKTSELVWNAKEAYAEELQKSTQEVKRGWFSSAAPVDAEAEQRKQLPGLFPPKYNPDVGVVAVGPSVWRHVLFGLSAGTFTNRPVDVVEPEAEKPKETESADVPKEDSSPIESPVFTPELKEPDYSNVPHPSITYPTLGYITATNQSGFSRFPLRVAGWFNRREMARIIGEEAALIVEANSRPLVSGDEMRGSEHFRESEKQGKDASALDLKYEPMTQEAEAFLAVDPVLRERLRVYE